MPDVNATTPVVIGTGSIGLRHLRVLRDRLGLDPVAVSIRDDRRQALAGEGFRVAHRDVLPDGPLATIVATDTRRHVGDALASLARGHVLVEKPLAPDAAGLSELDRAVRRTGHDLHVGFCLRFDSGLHMLKSALPDLGRLDSVRIECQSHLPDWRPGSDYRQSYSARADDGGVLRDLAHELDYAIWLFGRPSDVVALLGSGERLGIASDETADIMWRVPNGPVVTLRLDYVSPIARRALRVTGARGVAEWDLLSRTVTVQRPGADAVVSSYTESRDDVLERQGRAFLTASVGGDPGPLATLDEAAFVVALSDAARRSSAVGRVERIADWKAGK